MPKEISKKRKRDSFEVAKLINKGHGSVSAELAKIALLAPGIFMSHRGGAKDPENIEMNDAMSKQINNDTLKHETLNGFRFIGAQLPVSGMVAPNFCGSIRIENKVFNKKTNTEETDKKADIKADKEDKAENNETSSFLTEVFGW